ncbi:MAG: C-terminal binding protein [Alphaproteobacteria bacterium]|nr:C-terminal binding protein [Alphaproteobacteria bacterium]
MRIIIVGAAHAMDIAVEKAVLGPEFEVEALAAENPLDVPDSLWRSADAVLSWLMPIRAETIEKLERCRILVRFGVGYDVFDIAAAGRAGIPACNVPDYGTGEVADHAIAMMLALRRGLPSFAELLSTDPVAGWRWSAGPLMKRLATDRLGIVGYGRIGRAVATRAQGFGIDIGWFDPYLGDGAALPGRRLATLEALLGESDVVSLHCPLTEETRGLIDAARLQQFKPGAILVNTARGAIVDPRAVHDALRAGQLGGAAIDVLPQEPPDPDSPLVAAYRMQPSWAAGRLILSPHAAFYSPQSWREMREKAAATARDYLTKGWLRNCVNADFLPESGLRGRAKTD